MGAGDEYDPEPPISDNPEWCVCGICRPMQTPDENKCCGKRRCVTSYELFNNVCLDREVLTLVIRARCDTQKDVVDTFASRWPASARLLDRGLIGHL